MALYLKKGMKVRTTATLFGCRNGGEGLTKQGAIGTVVAGYGFAGRVRFQSQDQGVYNRTDKGNFDLYFSDKSVRNSHRYEASFPLSVLEEVIEPSLEGSKFEVIEDRGDGTFVVRKEN